MQRSANFQESGKENSHKKVWQTPAEKKAKKKNSCQFEGNCKCNETDLNNPQTFVSMMYCFRKGLS